VITNSDFRFFAQRQAETLATVIEPVRRDSAPALAAAAALAKSRDPNAVVLALAADHIILDVEEFRETRRAGLAAAEAGRIVTFGIKPTEPKDQLRLYPPRQADRIGPGLCGRDLGFIRLEAAAFAGAPPKSIDYAVMENSDRAAVVACDFRWSDIGSWDAIFEIAGRDKAGNAVHGDVVTTDATNCVIHSDDRLTAVLGAHDLVVVSTPDAVLVMPRERAQEVRELVAQLKAAKRSEASEHRRGHRPWGYYDSIDRGERFQVKRIVVHPGGTLSLQKHHHRAEHWVVVRGTAEVTIGEAATSVHENESIYIPIGTVHRLANRGKIPPELIEVQTGSYLGEDDIVRIEDVYKGN
jgi:mannose-6-phosphate isomerase-like protein (cupin superfamily)